MVIDTTAAHRRGRGGGRPAKAAPGVAHFERRPGGGLAGRPDRGPAAVAVRCRPLGLLGAGRHPASRGGAALSPLRAPGRRAATTGGEAGAGQLAPADLCTVPARAEGRTRGWGGRSRRLPAARFPPTDARRLRRRRRWRPSERQRLRDDPRRRRGVRRRGGPPAGTAPSRYHEGPHDEAGNGGRLLGLAAGVHRGGSGGYRCWSWCHGRWGRPRRPVLCSRGT